MEAFLEFGVKELQVAWAVKVDLEEAAEEEAVGFQD
jgi:hypothetical protein